MQEREAISLFKRGPGAEFRLLVLVVLSLALLVIDARWTVLEPVRQNLSLALYPFQRLVLLPGEVAGSINNWIDAGKLVRTEKEALQRQRIELAQLATHAAQLDAENQQLRRLLNVADRALQDSVAVEVLYEPANAFNRHLVFNKGSSSGIRPGMPVIDEGGVVGQVVRVTPFTSEAALLTDDKVSIPVQILRNGLRLILFGGSVPGKVEVRFLTAETDILSGDTLVTSGVGGLFPAGLPVARVDEVRHDSALGFSLALATPLAHPERYRHFLILAVDAGAASEKTANPDELVPNSGQPPIAMPEADAEKIANEPSTGTR